MSVIAETSNGAAHVVPTAGVETLLQLLGAVFHALGLPWAPREEYDVFVRGEDGAEVRVEWPSVGEDVPMTDVGIHGCEERVVVRAGARAVARAKLEEMGLLGEGVGRTAFPEALSRWVEEDTDAAREGLRLAVVGLPANISTTLLDAVTAGRVDRARRLLDAGAAVDDSLLLTAATAAIAELLLARGARATATDPRTGVTALRAAVHAGRADVLGVLLEHGANANPRVSVPPLLYAARDGSVECVRVLLEHGADVHASAEGFTPIQVAASLGDADGVDVLRMLFEHGADVRARDSDGFPPLVRAAAVDWLDGVEVCLDHGAEVDAEGAYGAPAVFHAITHRHLALVRLLHARGADVHSPRTEDALTPLHCGVAQPAWPEVVEFLLSVDEVDVNAVDGSGCTSLFLAVDNGCADLVEILVRAGADASIDTPLTPLMVAARQGDTACLRSLLRAKNVNVNARDDEGRTAISHAAECGNADEVRALLEEAP